MSGFNTRAGPRDDGRMRGPRGGAFGALAVSPRGDGTVERTGFSSRRAALPDRPTYFTINPALKEEDIEKEPHVQNHVPIPRSLDAIYEEDSIAAQYYAAVVEKDEDIPPPNFGGYLNSVKTWEAAMFHPQLLINIQQRSKYIRPRKIQEISIPFVIDNYDVKGQAETGSGKTAAFLLPIIQRCIEAKENKEYLSETACPYAVVIAPTRELVLQVFEQAEKFAFDTGISIAKAYGQYEAGPNLTEIFGGCDILIGTPGRLKQFIEAGDVMTRNLQILVFDEADKLMEVAFFRAIVKILNTPGFPSTGNRQTLIFSATFPAELDTVSETLLRSNAVFVTNKKNTPNKKIKQDFILVKNSNEKIPKLAEILLAEAEKLGGPDKIGRALVFTNSRRKCDMAANYLIEKKIQAVALSSLKQQDDREKVLLEFREGKITVLVSSDLAARGLDVKELDHVINMDMPDSAYTYIYRIGRTGRIKEGRATSLIEKSDHVLTQIVAILRKNNEEIPDVLKDVPPEVKLMPVLKEVVFDKNDPQYWY